MPTTRMELLLKEKQQELALVRAQINKFEWLLKEARADLNETKTEFADSVDDFLGSLSVYYKEEHELAKQVAKLSKAIRQQKAMDELNKAIREAEKRIGTYGVDVEEEDLNPTKQEKRFFI